MRVLKIGNTETHSLSEAMSALRELQLQVLHGRDPGAERKAVVKARAEAVAAEEARTTCSRALERYRPVLAAREVSPSHAADEIAQVRLALASIEAFGLPVLDLKVAHVEHILAACPAASRRARYGALNRFLRWAFRREDESRMPPTMALDRHERPKPGKPRKRVLSSEEVAIVYRAVETLPNDSTRDLLLFMLTTPSRRESETATMRWRDVDLTGKLWTQPKTKNGESHVYPLNAHALAILRRRYASSDLPPHRNALVFPGPRNGGVFVGWSNAKTAIDKRLTRLLDRWTFHDLRRTFTTQLASRGFDDGLLDLAINHKAARTRSQLTRTYNLFERLPERIALFDAWSRFLDEVLLHDSADAPSSRTVTPGAPV
jgi:integrase